MELVSYGHNVLASLRFFVCQERVELVHTAFLDMTILKNHNILHLDEEDRITGANSEIWKLILGLG